MASLAVLSALLQAIQTQEVQLPHIAETHGHVLLEIGRGAPRVPSRLGSYVRDAKAHYRVLSRDETAAAEARYASQENDIE
jgi:hypothetical protein